MRHLPLLVLLTSCTPSLRASAALTLACDWGGTAYRIAHASPGERYETNPILGPRPTQGTLALYILSSALVLEVVGRLLPEEVRPTYYGTITVGEGLVSVMAWHNSGVPVLGKNGSVTRDHAPFCGL